MSRKRKLFYNTLSGLLQQFVVIVCGFILPRYMLLYYGSTVNGLVASIVNFLGFISFLELGIGPVIQSNLYKPLADKNNDEISKIVISSERFFKRIAYIFIAYILILMITFPLFINTTFDYFFTASLVLIISISSFAQYYFGITYQLLLNADQKAYIQTTMQIVTVVLNTVFCVVLIKIGASVHIIKLTTSLLFLLRPIGQSIYIRKHYKINKMLKFDGEPIKQKWNGFAQHIAAVICGNTDTVVLTIFSSLGNVSIYSVYNNVANGITNTLLTVVRGLESLWGNMIAKDEMKTLNNTFENIEWFIHFIVTIVFIITGILITPFISVYTKGITDVNYSVPLFGSLLVIAYGARCLRLPYFIITKAAGHYKQTQNGAFISACLNIVISIVLVIKYGLIGVAIGTIVAMFYHTCYFAWYLRKNILNRNIKYFINYLIIDTGIGICSVFATKWVSLGDLTYLSWALMAIKVSVIVIAVSFIINIIFYKRILINTVKMFKNKKPE